MVRSNQIDVWTLLTIAIGYATFFPNTTQYPVHGNPQSWARVPAMRHALNLWPETPYFFHIDDHTLIMNTDIKIEDDIMNKKKLESMMLVDIPIIPPDSVIKTFSGLKGDNIDLVICQDKDGLMPNAFILRRGDWANFFLDVWFDPLYRSYNFQKAERHALEHIVQSVTWNHFNNHYESLPTNINDPRWHGTILAKIALIPQNVLTSYIEKEASIASDNGIYKDGDFTLFFGDCNKGGRSCVSEMKPHFTKLFAKEKSDLGSTAF